MPRIIPTVRVQHGDFNTEEEIRLLTNQRADVGAVVTFCGLCRDEPGGLAMLELEFYPGMAQAEITRIALEAAARWPVTGLTAIHRAGLIRPGENIVLVIAAAPHRHAAFEAASFLMDFLKTDAPFWKKQHWADGRADEWVSAKEADGAAKARWK